MSRVDELMDLLSESDGLAVLAAQLRDAVRAEAAPMERALRLIAHRCERQVRPAEEIERGHVVAFLEQGAHDLKANQAPATGEMLQWEANEIKHGRHLPGGRLPPTDPKQGLTCKAAGIPSPMRCPSCKAHDGLGLDPETGEPPVTVQPHRAG
jgi:hypothetical protein